MAIGDDAIAAGYPIVPGTGEQGKVKYGAQEINRTRDFVAQLKLLIPSSAAGFRTAAGINSGSGAPPSPLGAEGDIYFQVL
jgi:hypothetical protein